MYPKPKPQTCFVVMPFGHKFDAVWKAICSAILGTELHFSRCSRADDIRDGREIMARVFAEILKAEVIIADLTRKNPNVYYELGIAIANRYALREDEKTVIIITQSKSDVTFDVGHLGYIEYEATRSGLETLKRELIKTITEATWVRFRFAVEDGKSYAFPRRLTGPDGCQYKFDIGPVHIAVDSVNFCLIVRRYRIDQSAGVKTRELALRGEGKYVEIPCLGRWRLQLDHVSEDKAHFCVWKPGWTQPR